MGGMRGAAQGIVFAVVALLVAGPLLVLILTSFLPRGALPFQGAAFTWANYADVIFRPGTLTVLGNTLLYAGGSVVIGIALAVLFAFITERTDTPGRTTVRVLMFSWMAVPPLVFGYGWILLLNPGNGVFNVALQRLLGLSAAPLTPYSIWSLIAISGLGLVPTAYVMIGGLLRNMDPTLEDAALICGAGRVGVLRRITTPLLRPGILSVGIFLVMAMVQSFDLPIIIGVTARVPVLSTRIFLAASPDSGLPNYGLAAAFGVCLLALAAVLMAIYFRMIRAAERFRTVSGKGFRPRRIELRGAGRLAALGGLGLYFAAMLMPILILAWASLFPFYRLPAFSELGGITLDAYRSVIFEPQTRRVILNTVLLFMTSSIVVMLLSCLISWFAVRGGGRTAKALDMMAFAPMAIPPVVMAIAVLLVFLRTPINGSIWVLVIGHVTVFLAFGTRTMNGAFIQIHKELEDAALVSGASWGTGLRRILLPIVWPHVLNAWLWVVAHSARDLTFPLILLTSSNMVAASSIYLRWDYPDLPGSAAFSMMIVAGLMAIVIPVQIYVTARSRDGQG
jgi:iron(III) transport system permease protein